MKKIALITGASSGIGRELAHIHAATSGDLILVARSTQKLNELKIDLESKYKIIAAVITKDLTAPNAAQELYDEVKSLDIEVDYLINNAGFGGVGKFLERKLEEDVSMIQLNVVALVQLTHLFANDFVKKGSGKVLNVSSTASLIPGPLQATYYATKAFVTSFSNALSEELRGTGVTVTNLMPGATDTGFGKVSGIDKTKIFEKLTSAKQVAQEGYDAMLSGNIDVISGLTFSQKLLMKMMPFMPKKLVLKQVREMQEVTK
jgi:short-subunit dehydrogenase